MYEIRLSLEEFFGRHHRLVIMLIRDGKTFIAEPLVFRELGDYELIQKATFETNSRGELEQFFQAFLNSAESIGIKSEGAAKLKGLLEAKEAHLQDLRALVTIPQNSGKTLVRP